MRIESVAFEVQERIEIDGGQISQEVALKVAQEIINLAKYEDPDEEADVWWVLDRMTIERLKQLVKEVTK